MATWGLIGVGFTCATAAVGLHDSEIAWIPLAVLAATCFVVAVVQHWREGKVRPTTDGLNRALSEAIVLRARVMLRPYEKLSFDDDPLFQWAKRTYQLIREEQSAYADEFFGKDPSLGPAHFGTAYGIEISADRGDRGEYLERRIALLSRIIREARRTE